MTLVDLVLALKSWQFNGTCVMLSHYMCAIYALRLFQVTQRQISFLDNHRRFSPSLSADSTKQISRIMGLREALWRSEMKTAISSVWSQWPINDAISSSHNVRECPWVLSRLISSSKERFESGEPETKVCAGVRDPEPGVGMNMNVPVYTVTGFSSKIWLAWMERFKSALQHQCCEACALYS